MKRVVVSPGSDIATQLIVHWTRAGDKVVWARRDPMPTAEWQGWNTFVVASATIHPVSPFSKVSMQAWNQSIRDNFTRPASVIRRSLPYIGENPTIVVFSGAGLISAPVNYSAYTTAKTALVKFVECLAAERPDIRVISVGPGWVRTKIHAEEIPPEAKVREMPEVVTFIDWAIANAESGSHVHISDGKSCRLRPVPLT